MQRPNSATQPLVLSASQAVRPPVRIPRLPFRKMLRKNASFLVMLLPATLFVLIFSYAPMGGILLAFEKYRYADGIFGSPWNGLKNFEFFFLAGKAWTVTRNTMLYNLAFIAVNMFLQVTFAVILSEVKGKVFKKITQSSMFLPFFISWVVASSIFYNLFSYEYGVLNGVLKSFDAKSIDIYANASAWPFILVALQAWKSVGYGSVVYLASITGIDQQIYEAADIDGANVWQKIRFITLPSIVPTMIIMLLLALGGIFRGDFGLFYQLVGNNGNLLPVTDIIDTFVFRALMSSADIGMSAAAGVYQSILCLITILIANKAVKMMQPDYSLF